MTRRSAAALVVTIVALAAVVATTAVASATSYRYWTYWSGGSSWVFANSGASRVPADGSVEGWRFEISGTTSSQPPRYTPGFARICGTTPAPPGDKRVAVVIDYGTAADAPPGEKPPHGVIVACKQVPSSYNGYQILQSVTSLRVEQAMVCGIGGYPARGCAEPVTAPTPTPTPTGTHHSATATPQGTPTASQGGQTHSSRSPSASPTASPSPHHSTHAAPAHPRPSVSTVAPDATVAAAAAVPSSPTGGTVSGPWAIVVFAAIALVAGGAAWWARRRRQAPR